MKWGVELVHLRDTFQPIGEIAIAGVTEMESVRTGEVTKEFRRLIEVAPVFVVELVNRVCSSIKQIRIELLSALLPAIGQGQQIVHSARKYLGERHGSRGSISRRDFLSGARGSRHPELSAAYPAFAQRFRECFFHGEPVIAVGILFLTPIGADDFYYEPAELARV